MPQSITYISNYISTYNCIHPSKITLTQHLGFPFDVNTGKVGGSRALGLVISCVMPFIQVGSRAVC